MKIVLTGSLGHISQPLTEILVNDGHAVTLISSDAAKKDRIATMGAQPAIGNIQDVSFLADTFNGADVVYCMNPLDFTAPDVQGWDQQMDRYITAIRRSDVKRVIVLSGWVGHLLHSVQPEQKFAQLTDVAVTFVRPGPFFSNFYHLADMIRQEKMIISNYGGDDLVAFVAPEDIAMAIAGEMNAPTGDRALYVVSEEMTCTQAAQIIGEAIGIPELPWVVVPGEVVKQALMVAGITPAIAGLLVEMQENMHNGKALQDYYLHTAVKGKQRLRDFAQVYAAWYHQK